MNYRISQVSPWIDEAELERVNECLRTGWLTEGPMCKEFLERIKGITGSKFAAFAPNGTLGLYLALLSLDLPDDSEVIVPSFTFYASAASVVFAGLKPVFVDVQPDTFNLDCSRIEQLITEKTKAIMPVHIYGQSANNIEVLRIAHKYGLKVIEDAAQAFSVFDHGRHCGTYGDIGVISFFADKTITTGEGAVLLTQSEDIYRRICLRRNQGRPSSGTFIHEDLGMNFRITDIQAAIGLAQLDKAERIVDERLRKYDHYRAKLTDVGDLQFVVVKQGSTFVPFRFYIKTDYRDELSTVLEGSGVQTRSFFYPLNLQPKFKKYRSDSGEVSAQLYKTGMCLPLHHSLTFEDIDYICDIIANFFRKMGA